MSRRRSKQNEVLAELLAEQMAVIRDECQRMMKTLTSRKSSSEAKLAECARLSESLEVTNRFLKSAVAHAAIAERKSHLMKMD